MTLKLADLKDMSDEDIKAHIAYSYAGEKSGFDYGDPTEREKDNLASDLQGYELLIAYESVGSWGCDSASFFLLRKDGKLYENHGGHCSCYGFEGQWDPEETNKESLQKRSYFSMGGYDYESEANTQAIRDFIEAL